MSTLHSFYITSSPFSVKKVLSQFSSVLFFLQRTEVEVYYSPK